MVHPHLTLRCDRWFGVQRHARARQRQHPQIVRPISHGQDLRGGYPQPCRDIHQSLHLGLFAQNGQRDLSGQSALCHQQRVGPVLIKPQDGRDLGGKGCEPARHQGTVSPLRLHRGKQGLAARHQRDAVTDHMVDDLGIQPFQQPNPFDKRCFKIQFPIHRPRRNARHQRTHARLVGQFVDAFLLDHGRIHIRQQQPLFAPLGWL